MFAWSGELAVSRLNSMAVSMTAWIACPKVTSHGEFSRPDNALRRILSGIDDNAKASQQR